MRAGPVRLAAAAAHFGRDLERDLTKVATLVEHARAAGVGLLVLPDATLGGYLSDLSAPPRPAAGSDRAGPVPLTEDALPPAIGRDDEALARVASLAGDMVVCLGYSERDGDVRYNAAVCLSGDGVLGHHRKVHLPAREALVYAAGTAFDAFDTPIGRLGMLIDYDKTFPEAARTLALDGAVVLAVLSAWPASLTDRAPRLHQDRQSRLFDLYDCARAAENQVVVVSANQTGTTGGLRFLGQSKVVGPGGEVLSRTWAKAGLAVAEVDVAAEVARARRSFHHLRERRTAAYGVGWDG